MNFIKNQTTPFPGSNFITVSNGETNNTLMNGALKYDVIRKEQRRFSKYGTDDNELNEIASTSDFGLSMNTNSIGSTTCNMSMSQESMDELTEIKGSKTDITGALENIWISEGNFENWMSYFDVYSWVLAE